MQSLDALIIKQLPFENYCMSCGHASSVPILCFGVIATLGQMNDVQIGCLAHFLP